MAPTPFLNPQHPLEAYRTDLAAAPGVTAFGVDDASWLLLAELLNRRATMVGGAGTLAAPVAAGDGLEALDALLQDVLRTVVGEGVTPAEGRAPSSLAVREQAIADAALGIADQMEARGALRLAYTTLWTLERALPTLDPRRRGLTLASRARTARMAGAVETAAGLYAAVARIGRAKRDGDLVARALLGRAVLARRRGNYPESRALYRRALRTAEGCGAVALAGLAHHGLLIAASVAGDVSTALVHGWTAFERVGNDAGRQADLLGTLGAVAAAAGFPEAALGAYLGAARRSDVARVRLPALAGAAVCAARLGAPSCLTVITRVVEADLARDALPFERAQALTLLAEAWAVHAPGTRGELYAARALAIARAGGFHELVAQAEALAEATPVGSAVNPRWPTTSRAAPPAVGGRPTAGARRVLSVLEHLDGVSGVDADVGHGTDRARAAYA